MPPLKTMGHLGDMFCILKCLHLWVILRAFRVCRTEYLKSRRVHQALGAMTVVPGVLAWSSFEENELCSPVDLGSDIAV